MVLFGTGTSYLLRGCCITTMRRSIRIALRMSMPCVAVLGLEPDGPDCASLDPHPGRHLLGGISADVLLLRPAERRGHSAGKPTIPASPAADAAARRCNAGGSDPQCG